MVFMKSREWVLILIGFLLLTPFWVAAGEYDAGVQGKVILQTEATSNGDPITYLNADHPKITVMTVDIAPRAKTGWHSHPVPVYAYVMSGQLTVEIEGGAKTKFKKGDAIIEVVNVRHNGINNGKIPVRLVVFYTGGKDIPNVMKAEKP
jgi:quercetin dioxygenase-like cupin family protein